jgi:hypothetical protein
VIFDQALPPGCVQAARRREPARTSDQLEQQFRGGFRAFAWLVDRAGRESLTNKISPQIPYMGWEAAFEEAFGLSVDEFYIEFDEFLDQPGGHMEILHLG